MPAPRAARLLGALALLAEIGAAGKFDHLTSCSSCIAAGLGWSVKKAKCGGYANRQCPEETPPPAQQQQHTAAATEPEPEGAVELYGRLPVVGQIARMAWDHSDPDFATTLAAAAQPAVLSGSPHLKAWSAVGKWTPGWLASQMRDTKLNFQHNEEDGNFMFFRDHGVDKYNSSVSAWSAPSSVKMMSVSQFNKAAKRTEKPSSSSARRAKSGSGPGYSYYYKNVGPNTPFKALLSDISPYTWFVVDHQVALARRRTGIVRERRIGGQATAVMWFGMKGVRSTIHYDESYNFYVQVFGNKRWYMAPPKYYSSCYVHPMAHPSTRQCQIDWPHTDTARFPRATATPNASAGMHMGEGMELLTTVLAPGEVLFIPPGWFHATEALDTNLALNYWSKGINAQQHWMDLSLECDEQWKAAELSPDERRVSLLRVLLSLISAALTPPDEREAAMPDSVARSGAAAMLDYMVEHSPRVTAALSVISERFTPETADGFTLQQPDGWLAPEAKADATAPSLVPCLSGAQRKMAAVFAELGVVAGSVEARVLLGDMCEGYGRGMLSNTGAGPYFAQLREALQRRAAG